MGPKAVVDEWVRRFNAGDVDGLIVFQRGYFDQLSFFRQQGLAVPDTYLGAGDGQATPRSPQPRR